MDFGWPNVKIGQKMANGQLVLLALFYTYQIDNNDGCGLGNKKHHWKPA